MAIPLGGTFEHLAIVPVGAQRGGPWGVELHIGATDARGPISDDRLVGHAPTLKLSEVAGWWTSPAHTVVFENAVVGVIDAAVEWIK